MIFFRFFNLRFFCFSQSCMSFFFEFMQQFYKLKYWNSVLLVGGNKNYQNLKFKKLEFFKTWNTNDFICVNLPCSCYMLLFIFIIFPFVFDSVVKNFKRYVHIFIPVILQSKNSTNFFNPLKMKAWIKKKFAENSSIPWFSNSNKYTGHAYFCKN